MEKNKISADELKAMGLRESTLEYFRRLVTGETKKKGFFIFGPTGSGKTYEAKKIAEIWQRLHNDSPFFLNCAVNLRRIHEKDRYNYEGGNMHSLFEALTSTNPGARVNRRLLVLDDFAPEFIVNKYQYVDLYAIIDYYAEKNLPLVITSNYNLDDLAKSETVGERIVSRIIGTCNVIKIDGDDLRS